MTAAILPESILQILEAELSQATLEVVEWLCKEYDLPFDEVKKKLGNRINIELKIDEHHDYKVTKVTKRRTVDPKERCEAYVYCKVLKDFRRCSWRKKDCDFCKLHRRIYG